MKSSHPKEDYKKIVSAIIEQAMLEYIKLQHPKARKKKPMQEAFANAVDIFFLSSYTFKYFKNLDGSNKTLKDMLKIILDKSNPDLKEMKTYLIQSSILHWEKKYIPVVTLPSCFIFKGHVYVIEHTEDNWSVDHFEKSIKMNRKQNKANEKSFIKIIFSIIKKYYPEMSQEEIFYEILKMNQIQINY